MTPAAVAPGILLPVDAVLITQCAQNDFVRPLAGGEPLPNLVHVGRLEAERLCGQGGSLVPFLRAAHAVDPERLAIVHVVDRHDPARDADHFQMFRPHCVEGSDGARLVAPIESLAIGRHRTVEVAAADLNDVEGSSLAATLRQLLAGRSLAEVRIAVVGVWTDAKVSFLLYDLRTRLGAAHLATCSALTASRSLDAHFRALESLRVVLGVDVRHSPASLLEWLAPAAGPAPVEGERQALLAGLFDGTTPPALQPLHGGFSGSAVFIARGAGEEAVVAKVGRRDEIAGERFGNERVGRVLGDVVPRLLRYREGPTLAAMKVELASSADERDGTPTTFKKLWEEDASDEGTSLLCGVLEAALDGMLGRLYRTAEKDNADLLEVYGFVDALGRPAFVESVCARAEAVAVENGASGTAELLASAGMAPGWMAPAEFYGSWLEGRSRVREVYASLVHADLNLANILVSRRVGEARHRHVWLIDFARLTRLPCLTDFAKIENDLSFIMLPVTDEGAAGRVLAMQELRLAGPTLSVDGLEALARSAAELRYARLMDVLRHVAARIDPRGAAAMDDYRVALLRYAAHTLGFDEPAPRQRMMALLACARLAGQIAH